MSDDNGTTITDHAQHTDPSRVGHTPTPTRARTRTDPRTDTNHYADVVTATTTPIHVDDYAVSAARAELDRRYGPLCPTMAVGVAVLIAEGLAGCEQAWQERHEHAVDVAGYERQAKARQSKYDIPSRLAEAVDALTAAQYRGITGVGSRVATAALLHGVALSAKLAPVRDPGLDALAARVA